jgi:acetyl esterase/lipase
MTQETQAYCFPVIILHMGGYMVGSADVVPNPQIDYLASKDFVVVIPNYRLCPQVTAWTGAFADTATSLEWCQQTLPSKMSQSYGIQVDATRITAMGHSGGGTLALWLAAEHPELIKGVTAFYPSLYSSDKSTSAHKPYLGFAAIPLPENAASAESIASFCPADKQISEAPLARPGTRPPPRNQWQLAILKNGSFMETVMPDGKFELTDPCVRFSEVGERWPPLMFVQGDKDDLPGSGIAYVERAVKELKAAGAKKVEVERVVGESHVFDLPPTVGTTDMGPKWQSVLRGLDFLSQCV